MDKKLSIHPTRPKGNWIRLIKLGTLLTVCFWRVHTPSPSAGADQPVPVGVSKVRMLSEKDPIELPGTVIPWSVSHLAAEIDGRVEEILVKEGQFVEESDPLLCLRTRPLELEKELALAQREMVASRLEELKNGTRPEVIEAAKGALDHAAASLQLAEIELKQIEKLQKEGVLSVNEFDNAKAVYDQSLALVQERKSQLDELVVGPRVELINQEQANLSAADARIKIIEDRIDRAHFYAPFDGFIIKKNTEVGQWLEKGDPGLTLAVMDPLKVETNLPQIYFNQVKIGMTVKVILESRDPNIAGKTFKGKVIEKIPSLDLTSRTFPVRLKIDNSKLELAAGMLVKIIHQPQSRGNKLLFVPKDALVRTPRETSVWVLKPAKDKTFTAVKVLVTPGKQKGNMIAINPEQKKIKPGDRVVVQGNERLRPGKPVNIIKELP